MGRSCSIKLSINRQSKNGNILLALKHHTRTRRTAVLSNGQRRAGVSSSDFLRRKRQRQISHSITSYPIELDKDVCLSMDFYMGGQFKECYGFKKTITGEKTNPILVSERGTRDDRTRGERRPNLGRETTESGTRHNCVWDGVRHQVGNLDFLFSTKRFLQSRNHPPSGQEMRMNSAFSGIM